jgi:hypothetical protein
VYRFVLMLAIANSAAAAVASAGCGDRPRRGLPAGQGEAGGDAPLPADASTSSDASAAADAAIADAGDAARADMPQALAETGLYAPGSTSELAEGVVAYAPRYELWSDGALKQRWLLLPAGTQIDTSDMDAWRFPTGTKIWKEFGRDGRRLETRLIWKTDEGWFRVAFVWNDAETAALAAPQGEDDVRGTDHDVPQRTACGDCHDGQPDFVLGVSALQLAHDGPGVTLQTLVAEGKLSQAPTGDLALPDDDAWNALGYLHANCGSCHTPSSITWDKVDLDLWLRTAELGSIAETRSYQSTVGVALTDTAGPLASRIAPGDPAASGLVLRMQSRGNEAAMPPLASEHVDEAGVALVSTWIQDL